MPRGTKTTQRPELTLEERRERRRLRREKQRENNAHRAAKMHAARLKMETTSLKAAAKPKASLYVGCSGSRHWDWRDSFYAGGPQPDWFEHYLKSFDTVEINASFYSWPAVANVQTWQHGLGMKRFVYTVKVCELITHVKRFKGAKTLIKDIGMIADVLGDRMGCFPISGAAELSLHQGTAQGHRKSARSLPAQRRRIQARQLVERGSLQRLSQGRHYLLLLQRAEVAR